jgi:hypothetical protein
LRRRLSLKPGTNQAQQLTPVILTTGEVEIRRMEIQGQSGQKVSKNPISTNKLGMVVHVCHPSYIESTNRRIVLQTHPGKNSRH